MATHVLDGENLLPADIDLIKKFDTVVELTSDSWQRIDASREGKFRLGFVFGSYELSSHYRHCPQQENCLWCEYGLGYGALFESDSRRQNRRVEY